MGGKSEEKRSQRKKARLRRRNILIVTVAVLLVGGMILSATLGFADLLGGGRADAPPAGQDYLGAMQERAASLEKTLEEEPENAELMAELGETYYELAMYYWQEEGSEAEGFRYIQKGQDQFLQAVEEGFDEPWAKLRVAVLSFYLEENRLAESYFERVIELEPENPEALLYHGVFLASQGSLEEAREQWEKVLELVDEETIWAQAAEFYLESYGDEE